MNGERFRELANLIELEDRFDLGAFARRADGEYAGDDVPTVSLQSDCGTVGCIAGWVCAMEGVSLTARRISFGPATEDPIVGAGARLLGLSADQAERLFFAEEGSLWADLADQFGWQMDDYGDGLADWSDITAVQASKVLRMIADGEVEL